MAKAKPVVEEGEKVEKKGAKSEIVFVDQPKLKRAKDIVALLEGKKPRTDEEQELKEKFVRFISDDEVEKADYLEYVYTKLGGLIRTHEEQAEVDAFKKNGGKKPKASDEDDEDDAE